MQQQSKLYWDDLSVGQQFSFGDYGVSEAEIIEFGQRFDPMEFHTDLAKAKASPLGGLCASGIHTLAIMQRLAFDNVYRYWHVVAGKQLKSCHFLAPVFVDDQLSVTLTLTRLTPSKRGGRGDVEMSYVVKNQKQQSVLSVTAIMVLLSR